jgi:hypothetical protein
LHCHAVFDAVLYLQDRDGYWKMMNKYIGSDVTSLVTLPVIIFEPMTMLQKIAEVCAPKLLLRIYFSRKRIKHLHFLSLKRGRV